MKSAKTPKNFEPDVRNLDRKNSPIRYKNMSRICQLNLSRMLLRCPQNYLYPRETITNQQLIIITSKNPIKSNHSQNQIGQNILHRISETQEGPMFKSQLKTQKYRKKPHSQPDHNLIKYKIPAKIHNIRQIESQKKVINPVPISQKSTIKPKLFPQIKDDKKLKQKSLPLLHRDPQQLKNIKSQSYIIIEHHTNTIVLSHRASISLQIASLTKIMTFYVTIAIANKLNINIYQEKVIINDHIMEISGTSAEILGGQQYTIQQLLYGLMLPSGNDAATCLAEWGGKYLTEDQQSINKIKAFISQMNQTAKNLNLSGTRFANPHGLPHFQSKSTAYEVAKLCSVCLKDDLFTKIVSTERYQCIITNPELKTSREVLWENTNKLLRRNNFLGIKTGITVTAGPCLASAYKFRDKIYISVILRAPKISRRFKETRKLLHWALEKLYKNTLTESESKTLLHLKRNKPQLDSDNSEDQQEFKYDNTDRAEYKKRCNILTYEM